MLTDHRQPKTESPLQKGEVQSTLCVFASLLLLVLVVSRQVPSRSNQDDVELSAATRQPLISDVQIDINIAASHELGLLPGVGPVLADRIVDDRKRNGRFASVGEMRRVYGIGPKTIDEIRRWCVASQDDAAGGAR